MDKREDLHARHEAKLRKLLGIDFGLRDLVWTEPSVSEYDRTARKEVRYSGKTFPLEVINVLSTNPWTLKKEEEFFFRIGKRGHEVRSRILLGLPDNRSERSAKTLIQKIESMDKASESFPRGLGTTLYANMLDYIQYISDSQNQIITHIVEREPKGMSDERWDQLFLPILHNYGYELGPSKERNGLVIATWTKTYSPQIN